MPDVRCKWYHPDGTPRAGGCSKPGCRFKHPGQRGWDSLPYKVPVRCKFFDSNGIPIRGGCRTLKGCRFTHPSDPNWEIADRPHSHAERDSGLFAESLVPRSRQIEPDQRTGFPGEDTDAHHDQSPAEAMRLGPVHSDPRISGPSKVSTTDPKSTLPVAMDIDTDLTYASPSISHLLSKLRNTQTNIRQSSVITTSALSKSTDEHSRQLWKRRITLLAEAHNLIQEMSDIDTSLKRRIALHSTAIISSMAPSAGANAETLKDPNWDRQMNLEDQLNSVMSQLVEDDLWSVPPTQSGTSGNQQQPQLSVSLAELGRRLDIMETQLNKVRETAQFDVSIEDERASRPSKKRRTSSKRPFQAPINIQDLLGRLDRLQNKAIELVAEALPDERLLEKVDERVESRLLEKPVTPPLQTNSVKNIVQELDTELDALCIELADINTGDLVSQIGALRLETGNLKQTMDSLASDQQALQRRQASLDQQTRKIMEQLPELEMLSQSNKYITTDQCDKVIVELTVNIQDHINAELAQVHGAIRSYHEEIGKNTFARLEPTVVKTETLYKHLHSHAEARQA